MYTSTNNSSVKIAARFDSIALTEKESWLHPIEPFNGFDHGFYIGNSSYPSDDYRKSLLNVNSGHPEYYRERLGHLVSKITKRPEQYIDRSVFEIRPSDQRLHQLLELVYELDVNGGYLLIVDDYSDDIAPAEVLVRAVNYLYDNNFGLKLDF
jgi:hypothetical protein